VLSFPQDFVLPVSLSSILIEFYMVSRRYICVSTIQNHHVMAPGVWKLSFEVGRDQSYPMYLMRGSL